MIAGLSDIEKSWKELNCPSGTIFQNLHLPSLYRAAPSEYD